MTNPSQPPAEIDYATAIDNAGWRQGSVFLPVSITAIAPHDFSFDAATERLIVCTQSCSLVSFPIERDPLVEVMVAKLVPRYNERSQDATGRNQRKLHLKLPEASGMQAMECDIYRRFSFDRKLLLQETNIIAAYVGEEQARKLAGWISRFYTRIALPTALVEKMKDLRSTLEAYWKENLTPAEGRVCDYVPSIHINWHPRVEGAENYTLNFFFICSEQSALEIIEQKLETLIEPYKNAPGQNGLQIPFFRCELPSSTFLSDLDGYERFSDWDYLSDLFEAVTAPTGNALEITASREESFLSRALNFLGLK